MKSPNPQTTKPDQISRKAFEIERLLVEFRRKEIDPAIRDLRRLRFDRARNLAKHQARNGSRALTASGRRR